MGRLLMMHMLEQFFQTDEAVIDLLRGAEHFKGTWAERHCTNARLRAAHKNVRARIAWLIWFRLLPALEARLPSAHKLLMILSQEGLGGFATRVLRRLHAQS